MYKVRSKKVSMGALVRVYKIDGGFPKFVLKLATIIMRPKCLTSTLKLRLKEVQALAHSLSVHKVL